MIKIGIRSAVFFLDSAYYCKNKTQGIVVYLEVTVHVYDKLIADYFASPSILVVSNRVITIAIKYYPNF